RIRDGRSETNGGHAVGPWVYVGVAHPLPAKDDRFVTHGRHEYGRVDTVLPTGEPNDTTAVCVRRVNSVLDRSMIISRAVTFRAECPNVKGISGFRDEASS